MEPSSSGPLAGRASTFITPFAGTVVVRFSDTIIGSTDRAQVVRKPGQEPAFYIPFDDIYFEFLEKTNKVTHNPVMGTASHWRVQAMNASDADFMSGYETPEPAAAAIARHGTFDPAKAQIVANPAEDDRHTPI